MENQGKVNRTDSTCNMVAAARLIQSEHLFCMAHRLQRAVSVSFMTVDFKVFRPNVTRLSGTSSIVHQTLSELHFDKRKNLILMLQIEKRLIVINQL